MASRCTILFLGDFSTGFSGYSDTRLFSRFVSKLGNYGGDTLLQYINDFDLYCANYYHDHGASFC